MYAIQIRNEDEKRAERALRRFQLPQNYKVLTGHSILLQFQVRRGQPEDICFRCQKREIRAHVSSAFPIVDADKSKRDDDKCLLSGKRCPIEFTIDEVLLSLEALLVSGVKARIRM